MTHQDIENTIIANGITCEKKGADQWNLSRAPQRRP